MHNIAQLSSHHCSKSWWPHAIIWPLFNRKWQRRASVQPLWHDSVILCKIMGMPHKIAALAPGTWRTWETRRTLLFQICQCQRRNLLSHCLVELTDPYRGPTELLHKHKLQHCAFKNHLAYCSPATLQKHGADWNLGRFPRRNTGLKISSSACWCHVINWPHPTVTDFHQNCVFLVFAFVLPELDSDASHLVGYPCLQLPPWVANR